MAIFSPRPLADRWPEARGNPQMRKRLLCLHEKGVEREVVYVDCRDTFVEDTFIEAGLN